MCLIEIDLWTKWFDGLSYIERANSLSCEN